MTALMTIAMMVAMMLPSIAPVLWRHHRHLRASRVPRIGRRTGLLAVGYASVWTLAGVALFGASVELSPMGMPSMGPALSPFTVGMVVLFVGVIQRSRWKTRRLLRCRQCLEGLGGSEGIVDLCKGGVRLGIECVLSCGAPMAILLVTGLMDTRAMVAITAAITAERLSLRGPRVAQFTGALAVIAGIVICVRAIAATTLGVG